MKLADHFGKELAQLAERDSRIFVLDGDLADSDGAIHFAEAHPSRFLMAGIAEQNMVSVAAGMAACGMRPYVFSFAAFLSYRAYDQIRIGLSQCNLPVVLVASHAGGLSARNGKSHAAPNDISLMLSLPNLQVWAPADFADVELALSASLLNDQPCYVRMPRRPLAATDSLPGEAAEFRWVLPRSSANLVTTGLGTIWALEAAALLLQRGIEVGLLHCPHVNSIGSLGHELSDSQRIFVVEDHVPHGGIASQVRQLGLPVPLTAFGWPADYSGKSGTDDELRAHYGLSADAIANAISNLTTRPQRVRY